MKKTSVPIQVGFASKSSLICKKKKRMKLAPRQSCVWKLLDWTEYKEGESSFFADEFYLRLMQHGGDSIIEFLKSFFYAGFRGA